MAGRNTFAPINYKRTDVGTKYNEECQFNQIPNGFTHLNQIPFFRNSPNSVHVDDYDPRFEAYEGEGEVKRFMFKSEQAPLFAPVKMTTGNTNDVWNQVYENREVLSRVSPSTLHKFERPPGTRVIVGQGVDPMYSNNAFYDKDVDDDTQHTYEWCPSYTWWRPEELTYEELRGKTKPVMDITGNIPVGCRPIFHVGENQFKVSPKKMETFYVPPEKNIADANPPARKPYYVPEHKRPNRKLFDIRINIGLPHNKAYQKFNPNISNNHTPSKKRERHNRHAGYLKTQNGDSVMRPKLSDIQIHRGRTKEADLRRLALADVRVNKTNKRAQVRNQNIDKKQLHKLRVREYDLQRLGNISGNRITDTHKRYSPNINKQRSTLREGYVNNKYLGNVNPKNKYGGYLNDNNNKLSDTRRRDTGLEFNTHLGFANGGRKAQYQDNIYTKRNKRKSPDMFYASYGQSVSPYYLAPQQYTKQNRRNRT